MLLFFPAGNRCQSQGGDLRCVQQYLSDIEEFQEAVAAADDDDDDVVDVPSHDPTHPRAHTHPHTRIHFSLLLARSPLSLAFRFPHYGLLCT